MDIQYSVDGQAMPPKTQKITKEAFQKIDKTEIRWLSSAGVMINTRGTILMIDPLLEGFDMPLLVDMPILPKDIPHIDAMLITHIDNDHFSIPTCQDVKDVCYSYHAPKYVASMMKENNIPGIGHDIHETFKIKDINITLTPAWHNWQNEKAKYQYREWKKEDYCGYWIETLDGTIWMPGDSRLLEEHLHMPQPDMILFDFADDKWHITLEGAIQLANTYPKADLLCIHWGCVKSDMAVFNGNPTVLYDKITNPERIKVLAPGEPITLLKKEKVR